MKPPPQRDASAGLSEIHEATNDKTKMKTCDCHWWFMVMLFAFTSDFCVVFFEPNTGYSFDLPH